MPMKVYGFFVCVIFALSSMMFYSCVSDETTAVQTGDVEYVPFQSEENGKWGLMTVEGEVLFKDMFEQKPLCAMNGRFFAKNSSGEYELYTAEENPKKLGGPYKNVGMFTGDLAPVVEKKGPVVYIDKEGKKIFELESIDGVEVKSGHNFHEGMALVQVGDNYGYINAEGKLVVKAQYSVAGPFIGGKAVVEKYTERDKEREDRVWQVIDTKGNVLFSKNNRDFLMGALKFSNGVLLAKDVKNGQLCFLNEKGEVVGKRLPAKVKSIKEVYNGRFVYYDGNYGLMDVNGNVIIRAKYDDMFYNGKTIVIRDRDRYYVVNEADEKVSKESYDDIVCFAPNVKGYGECVFVKRGGKYLVSDEDGDADKDGLKIYAVEYVWSEFVESDFVYMDLLVEGVGLNVNGAGGQMLGALGKDLAEKLEGELNPDNYTNKHQFAWERVCAGQHVFFTAELDERLSYYNHYTGVCEWNDARVDRISVTFSLDGRMTGREKELFSVLEKYVLQFSEKQADSTGEIVRYRMNGSSNEILINSRTCRISYVLK